MRLQKYMALAGVSSRRKAEELIKEGKVKVNGKTMTEMGYIVNEGVDEITVNGSNVKMSTKKVYIMLNKPKGYITTVKDQYNRPTVLDLLEEIEVRVYPIGRLDYETSGLLLLTNDGDLTKTLTHPSHDVSKTYIARVKGHLQKDAIDLFEKGMILDGKKTKKASITTLKKHDKNSLVEITITEGRNRQVRRMCSKIGHDVLSLERVSIGNIKLDEKLADGKWRYLSKSEIEYLLSI